MLRESGTLRLGRLTQNVYIHTATRVIDGAGNPLAHASDASGRAANEAR